MLLTPPGRCGRFTPSAAQLLHAPFHCDFAQMHRGFFRPPLPPCDGTSGLRAKPLVRRSFVVSGRKSPSLNEVLTLNLYPKYRILQSFGEVPAMKTRLQKLRRKCTKFRDDARGNVAIFFAFGAFAVIGTVGIAIDTSVAYNVRSQLAAAVDAAALAGARNYASPTRDADI
ncbi:MAG TPA: hypothetical protein EYP07_14120 [Kiloniellaceae bacterium]|nr:hypothetical protein [Kiloniellaceae bacterium]